ncbi:MAG: hypothetical protein PVG32_16350 [Anaerolineales bacterium]|jgi:hypothetical protein
MLPRKDVNKKLEPVDLLDAAIEGAWEGFCTEYEVSAEMPDMKTLFLGAELDIPNLAAECVIINMLTDVIECLGRFSPWYTKPARAFGLVSIRDRRTNRYRWMLAPEALRRWADVLDKMTLAIRKNIGLIQATLLVDNLVMEEICEEPRVNAHCDCVPPRVIQINQIVLIETKIICDACKQPFS